MQGEILKAKGLYSYPNPLSEVPVGALAVADNVVINSESVVEPRRGFDVLTYNLPDPADRGHRFAEFQGKILLNYGTTKLGYYDTGSGWQQYSGTFQAPDVDLARMKFMQAAGNLLFTTSTGVSKLDAYNGTVVNAGGISALDNALALTGVSGFQSDNSQVAYRHVWGIRDANNNVVVGSPSARTVISNSAGGSRNVTVTITIPQGVTVNHFVQVYRSGLSATSSTEPNDELGLVYEANPSSGEITAGFMSFTDSTPDSLRGDDLYTNPSFEGIGQANDPPPYCKDLTLFQGMAFYFNVTEKQRLNLTILAVGGTSGVAINDTITVDGTVFTGKASENAGSREFAIVTSGTPAQNITDTTQSLVRVINLQSAGSVYAKYISGVNQLPGQFILEERDFGGSSFVVIASAHGTAYSPTLPTSGSTVASKSQVNPHGIAVSKEGQPEAVPLFNRHFAGNRGDEILRGLALRDSVFILKETDGIYRMSGTQPGDLSVELFDSTTRILSPETALVLNNQVWCLSDQGVVAVSDTGVDVKSLPIEDDLLELFGSARDAVRKYAFAIASETDRKYILFLPSSSSDTYCTQAYVFNTVTNSWTRWVLSKTCGFVNPADDKIYLADFNSAKVNQERKNFTITDFMDEGTSVTITAFSGTLITLTTAAGITVGDLLYQSASVKSVVTAIDGNQVTVNDSLGGWTLGAATVYVAYECVVEWVPYTAENPSLEKHFSEGQLFFSASRFVSAYFTFASDLSTNREDVPLTGGGSGTFGLFPFGSQPWGGVRRPRPFRTYVPVEKQRSSQLSGGFVHRQAQGSFRLTGLAFRYNGGSSETTR